MNHTEISAFTPLLWIIDYIDIWDYQGWLGGRAHDQWLMASTSSQLVREWWRHFFFVLPIPSFNTAEMSGWVRRPCHLLFPWSHVTIWQSGWEVMLYKMYIKIHSPTQGGAVFWDTCNLFSVLTSMLRWGAFFSLTWGMAGGESRISGGGGNLSPLGVCPILPVVCHCGAVKLPPHKFGAVLERYITPLSTAPPVSIYIHGSIAVFILDSFAFLRCFFFPFSSPAPFIFDSLALNVCFN